MLKSIGKVSALVAGLALAACGSGDNAKSGSQVGSVKLALSLPDGQTADSINLNLACPASNVNQNHVLNVTKGQVVASFGGLAPGACTAAMATKASDGVDCAGSANFTIVANQNTDVLVTLVCQGFNGSPSGNVKISTAFDKKACAEDRIKKVFAIPANVLLGESTLVEVETNAAAVVGAAKFAWAVRNDATNTGEGSLAAGTCSATSASCQTFTCTGLGAAPRTDARTGLPTSSAFLSVTLEDDDCFDTEEVWVDCIQSSTCGDGSATGLEECDDGNTASNDGCSSTCKIEKCGDGILQTSEECDGTLGVPAGKSCTAECKLADIPAVCGDGVKNQASEECDGTDGLLAGQVCGTNCLITPVCGNNIVETGEECDEATNCTACKRPAADLCGECIAALPEIGEFNGTLCKGDALCEAARDCVIKENKSCWGDIAAAACYCGDSQADIDGCENPTFVPKGRCAASFKAAAGAGATNAEVLQRYYDPGFPVGVATIVVDGAFQSSCKAVCF